MARGPCAGVRAARPGRARSLEVARCDRHRHRARHGPGRRSARAARRFLGLAERCAAVLLGGARFRQAVPALRRVPLSGAARERRVPARGVLAALPGGARLDAPGSPSYRRRGGASRFHRLGRPHRARARGAAGARQPRRAERRARRAAAGSNAASRDRRPVRRRARPGFPLLDLDRAGGARPRGRRGPPRLPGMARPPCPAFLGGQPHRRRRALDQLAACASRALTRALQGMVDFDLAAAGSARRERVLLSFHRKLVRVAGLAARGLGAVGDAAAPGRAAAFRAGVRLARHPARRGVHGAAAGCQPARAARAPSLLASQGVLTLRRGAAAALDWFGVITFAFFVGLIWLGYMGMMTGVPPRVAANFVRAAPGFTPQFNLLCFLFAAALTLAWLYIVLFAAPAPLRSVARWAAGVVLLWGTFAMLWMPWADYQKSYRSVALELRSKAPVGAGCIAAKQLGVPQAAALDYHAGLRPRAFDLLKPEACPLLLVQGSPKQELDAPGAGWVKLADIGRPGDKGERYRLYRLVK